MNAKDTLAKALESNLPVAQKASISHRPSEDTLVSETEEDFKFARDKLKNLLEKSDEALEVMLELAKGSEHPRAFEVLTGMIKNSSELTEQLLTLQKKRKELVTDKSDPMTATGTTTNNTIFVGSTSELQKFLRSEKTVTSV